MPLPKSIKKINILLLEDSPADVELIIRELKKNQLDFSLTAVDNRRDFERGLREIKPDIILSDHSLPQFDSRDAFQLMKELEIDIPFILVTGTVSEEFAVETLKAGAADYILKSNMSRLSLAIKNALEKKLMEEHADQTMAELLKFASLVESSTKFIGMADMKGNITYINKAGRAMLGLSNEKVTDLLLFDLFPKQDFNSMVFGILPSITKQSQWEGEFRFKNYKTGHIFPVFLYTYLILDPKTNNAVALACLAHDISEQKEYEAKLKRSEENLQNTLAELNTFIYKASHDLKGPLSSIIGLTGLAIRETTDPATLGYFKMIEESTQKLDSVLMGLIETMRIKEINAPGKPIDLKQIIEQVIGSLRFVKNADKVNFQVDVNVQKPFLSSAQIINSVLQNLIENAIKYHNYVQGESIIKITARDFADGVQLAVMDNGHGMSNAVKEKIFEMYYRGNEDSKGSGLGLYIVKTAVNRLNGTIRVESSPKEGSTFTVFIPSA